MPMMHGTSQGGTAATVLWGVAALASVALAWTAAGLDIDVSAVPPAPLAGTAAVAATTVPVAPSQPVVPRPIGAYGTTLERPLFEATRRPPPDEAQPAAEPVASASEPALAPADDLRIVGIMRPRKGSSSARVLVRSADAQAIWVEAGASVGGWTVSAIGDRTITIEGRGQRREISLFQPPAGVAN